MSPTATLPVWGVREPLTTLHRPPRRAEVVVVGGGITGVAILRCLRERGVDAFLVERDHIAVGASGRNAGFLLAGVAENYARAVSRYGRSVAAEVWAFTLENHALIEAVAVDAGHRRRGSLTVALDTVEARSLEEAATLLAEDRLPGELCPPAGPPSATATLFNPADGEIDPVRLVRGMAEPLASRITEGCPAVAVEDGENSVTVQTAAGSIVAGAVVLATNAWTSQLVPTAAIRPVRAQMLATAPSTAELPVPVYAEWGHRYWRRRVDGTVLVGGFRNRALAEEVGWDATTTARVQGHLDGQLRDLGVAAPVTHRWAGIMGFTEDGLALAGLPLGYRRVYLCGGYTGHGMGFAVNAAAALTRTLLDSTALPAWLDAARVSRSESAP